MTAEEILNKHFKDSIPESFEGEVWDERVIAAMEEYAEQEAKRIHSALKEQEVVGYLIEGISDTLKGFHELTDKPERFKGQPENFKVTPLVKK